eukprot:3042354-Alexandrium_andersonii.AAC.1
MEPLRKLWPALTFWLPCTFRRMLSPTALISPPWSLPQFMVRCRCWPRRQRNIALAMRCQCLRLT